MVEAGGVEPPSENASASSSPGADGYLNSLPQARAVTLRGSVASWFMVRSKLCAHTCTTHFTPKPGSWSFRAGRSRLKPRRVRSYCCSLIYKDAHFLDGRRIRPLLAPPRPRRNRYAPSSGQSPLRFVSPHCGGTSLRSLAPPLPGKPTPLGFAGGTGDEGRGTLAGAECFTPFPVRGTLCRGCLR